MWKHPWGYKEGVTICAGLVGIGAFLQYTMGPLNSSFCKIPYNIIGGGFFLGIMFLLHANKQKSAIIRWLSGVEANITSIGTFLLLVLILGVSTPAIPEMHINPNDLIVTFGFGHLTCSWIFVLSFFYMLTVLLLTLIRKSLHYKKGNIGFLLNHGGLTIALFAAIVGNGDVQRVHLNPQTGVAQWRGADLSGKSIELPLAIQLVSSTKPNSPSLELASVIKILTKSGQEIKATIEANKPVKVNGWIIYQRNPSQEIGLGNKTGDFELIYDPWRTIVDLGLLMMFGGVVCLFFYAKPKYNNQALGSRSGDRVYSVKQ